MKLTFGYEFEAGDILRSRKVPECYGTWEYAETDIVNLHGEYKYIAVDPLGKEPPVGGEINIVPGRNPEEVATRVADLIAWFQARGDQPSASCVNHGHVHVRVVGLRDNLKLLSKLTKWIGANQKDLVRIAYGYMPCPEMGLTKTARTYLQFDGGRLMPDWMVENVSKAKSFEDFIRLQACGKDGVSQGRPFRYVVNTYCLKHTDTVEFRCLRASLNYDEIYGSLRMAQDCITAALGDGTSFTKLMAQNQYALPPFTFDLAAYQGWEKTKWGKERGKKERRLIEI